MALKKIRLETETEGIPSTAIREISLLRGLKHHAVVELMDIVVADGFIYMVFEYLCMDLKKVLDKKKHVMVPALVKSYLHQLLEALAYCHLNRILHRDLKPQNLLVDAQGHIKLADFGLARAFNIPLRAYTHEVVTLWYRAPEILLGSKLYTTGVDIWSLGCIYAEMMMLSPLFCGDSEIDQLYKIFRIFGTPDNTTWPGITQLPDFKSSFPRWEKQTISPKVLKIYDDKNAIDLFQKMMRYDPSERISAREAVQHKYFDDVVLVHPIF